MKKKIFVLHIVTKSTRNNVCTFYVKSDSLINAVVFADNYLVADMLDISIVHECDRPEEVLVRTGHDIYDANIGRNYDNPY